MHKLLFVIVIAAILANPAIADTIRKTRDIFDDIGNKIESAVQAGMNDFGYLLPSGGENVFDNIGDQLGTEIKDAANSVGAFSNSFASNAANAVDSVG